MLWPATKQSPLVHSKTPVIIEIRVVFPAPLGPSNPKTSLSSNTKFIPFTAIFPLSYTFLKSDTTNG